MGERDFAGARNGAASDESGVTDGVMRSAEGARADESARSFQNSGDAVNARGFDGFFKRHGRKNGGNAFGEHGFSGAGRAEQKNVVSAAAGNFQRTFGGHLSANVAEVHGILRGFAENFARVAMHGFERFGRVDEIDSLGKRFHGKNVNAVNGHAETFE